MRNIGWSWCLLALSGCVAALDASSGSPSDAGAADAFVRADAARSDAGAFDDAEVPGVRDAEAGDAQTEPTDSGMPANDSGPAMPPDGGPSPTGEEIGPPFVAVGYASVRLFSPDGRTWERLPQLTESQIPASWSLPPVDGDNQWLLTGICKGEGRWIALGHWRDENAITLTSTDGRSWSLVSGTRVSGACAYGNGRFVANDGWSEDGLSWHRSVGVLARSMAFGGGRFVAVGDQEGGFVWHTSTGEAWTALPITYASGSDSDRRGYTSVAYGGGTFLAINSARTDAPVFEWDGTAATSFSERATPAAFAGRRRHSVSYGRGAFYVGSDFGYLRRADGSSTFEWIEAAGARELYVLAVTDEIITAVNAWSTDGRTFTESAIPSGTPAVYAVGVSPR